MQRSLFDVVAAGFTAGASFFTSKILKNVIKANTNENLCNHANDVDFRSMLKNEYELCKNSLALAEKTSEDGRCFVENTITDSTRKAVEHMCGFLANRKVREAKMMAITHSNVCDGIKENIARLEVANKLALFIGISVFSYGAYKLYKSYKAKKEELNKQISGNQQRGGLLNRLVCAGKEKLLGADKVKDQQ